jgi:hypothetical protein
LWLKAQVPGNYALFTRDRAFLTSTISSTWPQSIQVKALTWAPVINTPKKFDCLGREYILPVDSTWLGFTFVLPHLKQFISLFIIQPFFLKLLSWLFSRIRRIYPQ